MHRLCLPACAAIVRCRRDRRQRAPCRLPPLSSPGIPSRRRSHRPTARRGLRPSYSYPCRHPTAHGRRCRPSRAAGARSRGDRCRSMCSRPEAGDRPACTRAATAGEGLAAVPCPGRPIASPVFPWPGRRSSGAAAPPCPRNSSRGSTRNRPRAYRTGSPCGQATSCS